MPKRFLALSGYGVTWSVNKRIAVGALVLTVLLASAATAAYVTGRSHPRPEDKTPPAANSASPSLEPPKHSAGSASVPSPPRITEPVAFAKATARMLWSYDTRDTSRDEQLAVMRAWMTHETKYADWDSIAGQVPDPLLWSRMADQDQHATAQITEGHYPDAFKQALADDPSAITEAYIYVVTVNGTQHITWRGGGAGSEGRAVMLAVQCRPGHDCRLAAIAPSVTQ